MKNSYNPFTTPDDFFENGCCQAVSRYRRRRRAITCGFAAMVVMAFVLVIPVLSGNPPTDRDKNEEIVGNNLASMYEYDIFLQINFTK